jgi:hypothetical protein
MEGENKNMKMKKLAALALAGVLCMGMSTVALAAPSVGPEDAYSATNKDGDNVKLDPSPIKEIEQIGFRGTDYDGWNAADPEKASDAVKDTLKRGSVNIEAEIVRLKESGEPDVEGKIARLQAQKAAVDQLANSDVLIEIADLVDLDVAEDPNGDTVPVDARNPLKVRFVLNKRLKDLEVGQAIRIMHKVDGLWQVYEGEVKWDSDKSEFYVEHEFTSLSPVAILRINSDGSTQVVPPTDIPGDSQVPNVTPDANGNITADQLADLIAQRLRANNAGIERTSSTSGRSPKTGE